MLIQTKLQPPSLRSRLLLRKNLIERLCTAEGLPLVFISGPAGSGKTSLTCQWINQKKFRVAWFSIDEEDNAPDLFFRYLLTAFIRTDKRFINTLEPLLSDVYELRTENVIPRLIETLSSLSHGIRLILDDFHHITDDDILDGMVRLMRHMPARLQLVILSRFGLPAPMEAAIAQKGHMEIMAEELKFTEAETVHLFNKVIPSEFSADQIRDLNRHMEGWAAGLQLIGLSVKSQGHIFHLPKILNQVHEQVANYLIHDILRMQSEKIQNFVFATALLDRFNAELCAEVSGMPEADRILEHLERMNLFLIPMDPQNKWFRYHHIFSEVVRRQAADRDPDAIPATLRKAAKWLAQNDQLEDALRYAFRSDDFEFTADLMEDHVMGYLETFDLAGGMRWILKLPERVLSRRALLQLQLCAFLSVLMELSDVKEILVSLENNATPDFSRYSGHKLTLCQDLTAYFKCVLNIFHAWETADVEQLQVLRDRIGTHNPLFTGAIEMQIVSILISRGDFPLAESFLDRLSNLVLPTQSHQMKKKVYHAQARALIARHQGRLRQAEEIIQRVRHFFHRQGGDPIPMAFFLERQLGTIFYLQNKLEKARQCAADAVKYCETFGLVDEIMAGNELWLQLHLAAGEHDQADRSIQMIQALSIKLGMAQLATSAEACAARFAIDQGNLTAAGLWAQRRKVRSDEPFSLLYAMESLTLARLLYARGQYDEAARRLKILSDRCAKRNLEELGLQIDILQSATHYAMNQPAKAISLLKGALAFSEAQGYIRPFVNDSKLIAPVLRRIANEMPVAPYSAHIENILKVCGIALCKLATPRRLDPGAQEQLTHREIEILGWVAQGFQNKEIAQKAFITITTVKCHVSNIMLKLHAKTRTQAVMRAKELRILDPDRHTF